jgi:hypothetical protein
MVSRVLGMGLRGFQVGAVPRLLDVLILISV